ncbi:conserved hypothetical protein [Oleispira antarctica RB-8]|uniref:Uncharacterized protein n=1 Tax=Oleispira antarctica RB-8 TaxID=698738 RepID=R4YTQ8_OLEAN|nr:conserved hypothetical protein [Oleispira antarctica RB-8]
MDFETLSQWRRAVYCAAMASRNRNHVLLFSDMLKQDAAPFTKLQTKTWAYLEGELKSLDNLERFFNEFDQWQTELLKEQDSFGAEAAQQACQSLYSATYALLDESANDCELVQLSNQQLFTEMADMGSETDELIQRHNEFEREVFDLLTSGKPKRECILAVRKLATEEDESSLGISLD